LGINFRKINMKKFLKFKNFFLVFFLSILPLFVFGEGVIIENPIHADTFEELLDNIIHFIFILATALLPLIIIISGFMFVTAGGDPAKTDKAKKLLLYTAIGYGIILLARGLIAFLRGLL